MPMWISIAKDFTNRKESLGQNVLPHQPGQLLVKLVKDELTELMGGDVAGINLRHHQLFWCQACKVLGKHFSGKLANYLLTKDETLIGSLWYLPSSCIQQLYVVGDSIGVEVYIQSQKIKSCWNAQNAIKHVTWF
jgi:signal recognition particle subunit SRP54